MTRRRTSILLTLAALCSVLLPVSPARANHGTHAAHPMSLTAIHPSSAGSLRTWATLWANGSATGTTRLASRAYRIAFVADASWCDGPAQLEVRVDGELVMRRPVVDNGRYAIAGEWAPGDHHLSFRFTNDRLTDACDRNVRVGRVAFRGPVDGTEDVESSHRITTVETWTWLDHATVTPITAGRTGNHINSGWGSDWEAGLWGRGTLRFELDGQGDDLELFHRAEKCDGPPETEIRVDGRVVHTGPLPGYVSRFINVVEPGGPPLHTVEIELLNPHRGDGCQRRVWFEEATIGGWV